MAELKRIAPTLFSFHGITIKDSQVEILEACGLKPIPQTYPVAFEPPFRWHFEDHIPSTPEKNRPKKAFKRTANDQSVGRVSLVPESSLLVSPVNPVVDPVPSVPESSLLVSPVNPVVDPGPSVPESSFLVFSMNPVVDPVPPVPESSLLVSPVNPMVEPVPAVPESSLLSDIPMDPVLDSVPHVPESSLLLDIPMDPVLDSVPHVPESSLLGIPINLAGEASFSAIRMDPAIDLLLPAVSESPLQALPSLASVASTLPLLPPAPEETARA